MSRIEGIFDDLKDLQWEVRWQEKEIIRLRKRLAKYEKPKLPKALPPKLQPKPKPTTADSPLVMLQDCSEETMELLTRHFGPLAPIRQLAELPPHVLLPRLSVRMEVRRILQRFGLEHPAMKTWTAMPHDPGDSP